MIYGRIFTVQPEWEEEALEAAVKLCRFHEENPQEYKLKKHEYFGALAEVCFRETIRMIDPEGVESGRHEFSALYSDSPSTLPKWDALLDGNVTVDVKAVGPWLKGRALLNVNEGSFKGMDRTMIVRFLDGKRFWFPGWLEANDVRRSPVKNDQGHRGGRPYYAVDFASRLHPRKISARTG